MAENYGLVQQVIGPTVDLEFDSDNLPEILNAIHIKDVEKRPWLWEGVGECLVEDTDDLLVGWKNLCFGSYLYRKSGWAPWAWFDG